MVHVALLVVSESKSESLRWWGQVQWLISMHTRTRCLCHIYSDFLTLIYSCKCVSHNSSYLYWLISNSRTLPLLVWVWFTFRFAFIFGRMYHLTFGSRLASTKKLYTTFGPTFKSETFTFCRPLLTTIVSHSRVLNEVHRHHLVNVLLWQLFQDALQGSIQLIGHLRCNWNVVKCIFYCSTDIKSCA